MPTEVFFRLIECSRQGSTTTLDPDSQIVNPRASTLAVWEDRRSGNPNPGWKQAVMRHESAGTNFAGDRWKIDGGGNGTAVSSFTRKEGSGAPFRIQRFQVSGSMVNASDLGPMDIFTDPSMRARVHNRALSEFYQQAWSAVRSFQGGVFLGEIGETLNMIRRPGRAIRRLIDTYVTDARRRARRVRRGRPADNPVYISDANKVISDTWLEYSFGLRPLMSDVRDGANALKRLASEPHEYIKVRAQEEEEKAVFDDFSSFTRELHPFIVYRINRRMKVGYSVRIIGEVKCEVSSPLTMSSEVLGFSPESFVPTVWELIPYSFLVDYFSNIGDVISAWSFPSSKIAWINRSIRSFAEREALASKEKPGIPIGYDLDYEYGPTLSLKGSRTTVARDYGPLGFPSVTLEVPGSSTKWLNIGALAHMRVL